MARQLHLPALHRSLSARLLVLTDSLAIGDEPALEDGSVMGSDAGGALGVSFIDVVGSALVDNARSPCCCSVNSACALVSLSRGWQGPYGLLCRFRFGLRGP